MANYIRTSASFSDLVNSEIKAANQLQFADSCDLPSVEEALKAGRDGVTEYVSGFVGSLAQQYDRDGYLTPKQVSSLMSQRKAGTVDVERNLDSQHIGSIREVMVLTLKLNRVIEYRVKPAYMGDNGLRKVSLFQDEAGNEICYRGFSKSIADCIEGNAYRIKCEIKDWTEYQGCKQTVIKRPAVLFEAQFNAKPKVDLRKDTDVVVKSSTRQKKRIKSA